MKYMNVVKKHSAKVGVVVSSLVLSAAANATIAESLDTAISDGQTNYTTVVVGLIGLAAIGFGLRAIISAMR